MKKWSRFLLPAFGILLTGNSCTPRLRLLKTTYFESYPSASSLDYGDGHLYMLGDDAPQVMVLDSDHQVTDSIALFEGATGRLAKSDKPDFESTFFYQPSADRRYLITVGSFSTPRRNRLGWIDLGTRRTEKIATVELQVPGIEELNIEGAALVGDQLVLSNRANNSHPTNYLVLMPVDASRIIGSAASRLLQIDLPTLRTIAGISSVSYCRENDLLLFTASTENTTNAYTDGAIGNSYLGLISHASKKLGQARLTPDRFLSLAPFLHEKTPQKIESVVVEKCIDGVLTLHLAADNDNGKSTLFKMQWRL
ncbi:MAG: hypothetical protein JWP27_1080 [Flaviaesturariibacter sp.]|nr:hypothetical protein [Flaviaesturariibacter sp.]